MESQAGPRPEPGQENGLPLILRGNEHLIRLFQSKNILVTIANAA
jgi:hypothetical protein